MTLAAPKPTGDKPLTITSYFICRLVGKLTFNRQVLVPHLRESWMPGEYFRLRTRTIARLYQYQQNAYT